MKIKAWVIAGSMILGGNALYAEYSVKEHVKHIDKEEVENLIRIIQEAKENLIESRSTDANIGCTAAARSHQRLYLAERLVSSWLDKE